MFWIFVLMTSTGPSFVWLTCERHSSTPSTAKTSSAATANPVSQFPREGLPISVFPAGSTASRGASLSPRNDGPTTLDARGAGSSRGGGCSLKSRKRGRSRRSSPGESSNPSCSRTSSSVGGTGLVPMTVPFEPGAEAAVTGESVEIGRETVSSDCGASAARDSALGILIGTPARLGGASALASPAGAAAGWRSVGLAFVSGTRVKLSVPCAPSAVSGRCGSGVPHIPQKRSPTRFSYPQALQTTMPPQTILNDEGLSTNLMEAPGLGWHAGHEQAVAKCQNRPQGFGFMLRRDLPI